MMKIKRVFTTMLALWLLLCFPLSAFAHSGRTDSSGGHRDNKNASGLGSYHYHCGGHPAHLHPNGVCPYAGASSGAASSSSVNAGHHNEWVSQNGNWCYYNGSGSKVTGWQSIGGCQYYFDNAGTMLKGWQRLNSAWYYFDAQGKMAVGWTWITDSWYCFDPDGRMLTGWLTSGGDTYCCDANGKMLKGWQWLGEEWYYFDGSGLMATGWKWLDGAWYCFDADGSMYRDGTYLIDGESYSFAKNGAMAG